MNKESQARIESASPAAQREALGRSYRPRRRLPASWWDQGVQARMGEWMHQLKIYQGAHR